MMTLADPPGNMETENRQTAVVDSQGSIPEKSGLIRMFYLLLLRSMYFLMELAPLSVVIWLGILLGVSGADLYMHSIAAISTISLVHCIASLRHVSEYIRICGEYKDICHDLGCPILYYEYDAELKKYIKQRSVFYCYTVLTIVTWIGSASCFVAFLAKHNVHESTPSKVATLSPTFLAMAGTAFAFITIALAARKVREITKINQKIQMCSFMNALKQHSKLHDQSSVDLPCSLVSRSHQ
jgi:hypothetical protein